MDSPPFVSVIIPARNEESHISKCLESIIGQDYPKDKFEIIIIDGQSQDETIQQIKKLSGNVTPKNRGMESSSHMAGENEEINRPDIRVIENPKLIQSVGLNIGIQEARGDYIIRMDAHTVYTADYISKCVEWLDKTGAHNVGGPIESLHGDETILARTIALASSSVFGVGNSKFRTSRKADYVDTVTFGAWPKTVFKKVGLFDERLVRNQDIEHNARIRKKGGSIFMTPEIKSYYYCRRTLKDLWKQNFGNGKWVIYTKLIAPYCLSWRHFTPLIFVASLIVTGLIAIVGRQFDLNKLYVLCSLLFATIVASYTFSSLFFSARLSFKKGYKYIFILPIIFSTLHFSYGLGSIWGLLTLKKLGKRTSPNERLNQRVWNEK